MIERRLVGTPDSDDHAARIAFLVENPAKDPILIERPLVETDKGVRLCRPDSAVVLDILPPCDKPFAKEDGEVVIDADGQRVR